MRRGVRLLATALITPGIISNNLNSYVDRSTTAGLIECLLCFLKGTFKPYELHVSVLKLSFFRAGIRRNCGKIFFGERSTDIHRAPTTSHHASFDDLS